MLAALEPGAGAANFDRRGDADRRRRIATAERTRNGAGVERAVA
jgi:hypothetical protein